MAILRHILFNFYLINFLFAYQMRSGAMLKQHQQHPTYNDQQSNTQRVNDHRNTQSKAINFGENNGHDDDESDDEDTCIGECKRYDFIVNFTEIGWEKWITYPKSFNAYYCKGDCPTPLNIIARRRRKNRRKRKFLNNNDEQVTNYAQIMSILEYKNSNKYHNNNKRLTHCVPTKLQPLEIIYETSDGLLEIRKYDNMIVKQCGCR